MKWWMNAWREGVAMSKIYGHNENEMVKYKNWHSFDIWPSILGLYSI